MTRQSRESKLDEMFIRAEKMWHRGQLRNAFRLFLVAANAGDKASQLNVGCFYDNGVGTKRNREEALRSVGSNATSYTWDFENRLTSVILPGTGGTVSFKYDPFGR